MKHFLLLFFILLQNSVTFSQKTNGKIYAVVVGISTYENLGDDQLAYADKDAQVFYNYLRSKAGGTVPEENIKMLLNKDASFSAIYDALHWLLQICSKDDMVYFYFSGHGDLENYTISQDGYLISYNTPRTNYVYNAVSIEYLNKVANTLSARNNGKVILITDACHSGKLAGKERGVYLVGEQLRASQKNEIRLTSCSTDQLSNEDIAWGGGRGVFSYYLIKGLEGFADKGKDGIVTVSEIRDYMDSCFKKDNFLKKNGLNQTPVIQGVDQFDLSKVNQAFLDSLKKSVNDQTGIEGLKPLVKKTSDYILDFLKEIGPEKIIDFNKLGSLPATEIAFAVLKNISDSISLASLYLTDEGSTYAGKLDSAGINQLEKKFRQNEYALNQFNNRLVELFTDRGQEVINQYLDGNEAELERRRYYDAGSNGYDVYPLMFAIALKLTSPENHLHKALLVKQHYFSGVAMRLKLPSTEEAAQKQLVKAALAEEKMAYELERSAAYIQNELGTLYYLDGEFKTARKFFLEATVLSPEWVIPWANLIGLYSYAGMNEEAIAASKKAIELKPDLPEIYSNSGFMYQKKGDLLMAEELCRKSIKLNSRHYLPFERLAYIYQQTTQYALADSFFYEAAIRKKGLHVKGMILVLANRVLPPFPPNDFQCFFDSLDVGRNDVLGHFVWGYLAYQKGNMLLAERKFKETIALDKNNPLAFHYLGELLYKQQRWKEADIVFNYAVSYYLTDSLFTGYCDSMITRLPKTKSKDCIAALFKRAIYGSINDHYYLGTLYESWNHFYEAESEYRIIMHMDSTFIGGYYKLWTMLEKNGHAKDAEQVLRDFSKFDSITAKNELAAFYQRTTERYPNTAGWYYEAGAFFYGLCYANQGGYKNDIMEIPPDTDNEVYKKSTIEKDNVIQVYPFEPADPGGFKLPGIDEYGWYSDIIYFPRTKGIYYLKKVDSLIQQNQDALADVNYKIGDLYVWQQLPGRASRFYQKAVDLKPNDANTRIKLTDTYASTYQYQDALVQLDSLYKRKEINFPKQLLMAKYFIHSGKFSEAGKLLADAKSIQPYKMAVLYDLYGRLQLLSGHPKQSLPFYNENLLMNPGDSISMYKIASVYAKMGDTKEALKWLEKAISNGFRYGWVLRSDPVWDRVRKNTRWIKLTEDIPQKSYAKTIDKNNLSN